MTSEETQKFQAALSIMRWFDGQGGHIETKGVSPTGDIIPVPLHRHHVTMNILRVNVGVKYHVNSRWMLEAIVPYAMRAQEATVEEIEGYPITAAEMEAILRNGENHHRSETYTGIQDVEVLFGYNVPGLLRQRDVFAARLGTTVPFGATEANPWELGEKGLKHLHIQFGTGTFNPVAELSYRVPLYGGLTANMSLRGKLPFYENSKTYRGSRELAYSGEVHYQFTDWLALHASYLGFYQSYAYWAGKQDINSGLRYSIASLGTTVRTPYDATLLLTVALPLQQETLYNDSNAFLDGTYAESDAFEFGPLVSLTVLHAF